jgi:hypothetical protein
LGDEPGLGFSAADQFGCLMKRAIRAYLASLTLPVRANPSRIPAWSTHGEAYFPPEIFKKF